MKIILLAFVLFFSLLASAQQQTKRVLFLGNSYTSVNDLPLMFRNLSLSVGDAVIYDGNLPGGHTFNGHCNNQTSLGKINQGNWDFVVLQEQSQYPSFPDGQVATDVYPYARKLDSLIQLSNPCAETVFYMTWGRKNGDANNCSFFPPLCTYEGMDSLLNLRYRKMANDNDAILSPVGAVWHKIRADFPTIELYSSDESHPSVAGTYAAACSFYATIFRKDPTLLTFDAGLPANIAATIRAVAKSIVYDQLMEWNIGKFDVSSIFSIAGINELSVDFLNASENANSYVWDFGDGTTSTDENPSHLFPSSGTYLIQLTAEKCGESKTYNTSVSVVGISAGISTLENTTSFQVYPNPSSDFLSIELIDFSSCFYQILSLEGKILQSGEITGTKTTLDLTGLESGIYSIQLTVNKTFMSKKFILKK